MSGITQMVASCKDLPPRVWTLVRCLAYTLLDCGPPEAWKDFVNEVLDEVERQDPVLQKKLADGIASIMATADAEEILCRHGNKAPCRTCNSPRRYRDRAKARGDGA